MARHQSIDFAPVLGFGMQRISLRTMSTSQTSPRSLSLALFALLTSQTILCAQSTPSFDSNTKEIGAKACAPAPVKPIKRAKHPAKTNAIDWTTMASTYSHDAQGQRVDQFAAAVEPQSNERADYVRSGYRSSRSSLQTGFSADHYHVTEQWGQPVQPYGQWRYPNRPFSVPYSQWGPQLPQVLGVGTPWGGNNRWNGGPWPFHPGMGQPGMGQPGMGQPGMGQPGPAGPNGPNGPMFPAGNNWNGNSNWNGNPWGPQGFGNGTGNGFNNFGLGVGPANALPASQDEYYQQAPTLRAPGSHHWNGPFQMPNN
jgi:hypothetical protein